MTIPTWSYTKQNQEIKDIKQIIKDTPNDYDLGKKLRAFILERYEIFEKEKTSEDK